MIEAEAPMMASKTGERSSFSLGLMDLNRPIIGRAHHPPFSSMCRLPQRAAAANVLSSLSPKTDPSFISSKNTGSRWCIAAG